MRLLLLLLVLAASGCDLSRDTPLQPTPIRLTAVDRETIGHSNAFGLRLFARVAAGEDGNLMLSPLSAATALTMLLNGADSTTYTQIHTMLGYGPLQDLAAVNASYESLRDQLLDADPDVRFALANAVFYDRAFFGAFPVKAPFLAAMQGPFGARVEGLDFANPTAALAAVNGWAGQNTNGRIPQVLDRLDPDLVMILMNALHFKGDWTTPFDADDTAPADFRRADGRTVRVPMMSASVPARQASGDGYRAVELPYGRRNFSMVVMLPEMPLAAFAARLDAGLWDDVTTRLDTRFWTGPRSTDPPEWDPVDVRLPRFTFSTDQTLNPPLQALGMTDAFDPARANLSRIADAGLSVSFVKQNTFVDVNEEGTEAAAVTTIGVRTVSAPEPFAADRPFVFAIRERTTNTLLFLGQVADPSL